MTDTSLKDLGEKGTIDKLEGTSKPLLELEVFLVWRKHKGVLPANCTWPHSILRGAVQVGCG